MGASTLGDARATPAPTHDQLGHGSDVGTILSALEEGVIVQDAAGRVTLANPAAERLLGIGSEQLIAGGPPPWKPIRENGETFAFDELPGAVCLATGQAQHAVIVGISSPDRSTRWLRNSAVPLIALDTGRPWAVVSSFSDVTEALAAERWSRQMLARYEYVATHAADAISVIDRNGFIVYASPACERVIGWPPADLVGKQAADFMLPDVLSVSVGQWRKSLLDQGEVTLIARFHRKDGESIWLESSVALIRDTDGKFVELFASTRDITHRKAVEEELERRALTDPLTGIANRTLLLDRIQQALHRQTRRDTTVTVLLIDLDRFKLTNDSLGHLVGDEVLMAAARRLTATARPSDTVARLGGDEFAVVAEGLRGDEDVDALASRFLDALRQPISVGTDKLVTTASLGATVTSNPGERPTELLRQADLALYQAKELGRDGFARYDDALEVRAADRLALERILRRALAEEGLSVEYQPIVDLRTEQVVMAEALARVHDPDYGYLTPERFSEVADEAGLLGAIDEWVLSAAVAQMARWNRTPGRSVSLPVAVNVSAHQLADPCFAERVGIVLETNGVTGSCLQVEVAERTLLEARPSAHSALEQLRGLGIKIGLEHFGSGFSALSFLETVPLDFVKIDRSFVADLCISHRSGAIVTAIIELAHALGLTVVAEGVETADQMRTLQQLRCDRGQGLLFSPAQPPNDFDAA